MFLFIFVHLLKYAILYHLGFQTFNFSNFVREIFNQSQIDPISNAFDPWWEDIHRMLLKYLVILSLLLLVTG